MKIYIQRNLVLTILKRSSKATYTHRSFCGLLSPSQIADIVIALFKSGVTNKLQLEVDKLQLEQERKELENRRIRAEADKAELEKTKLQLEIATQQRHARLETARLKAEVELKQQQAYEKERENSIWLQSEDDDEVSRRGWEDYEKRAAALRRANGFN